MAVTKENPTLLRLDPITVPPYSARGIVQTLDPIPLAFNGARTVDGSLINFSLPSMQKFRSVITCRDLDGPKLDGVWQGQVVIVDCVNEWKFITTEGLAAGMVIVPGSERVEGIYTYYRPRITMMITSYTTQFEEYPAYTNWQMELEEV